MRLQDYDTSCRYRAVVESTTRLTPADSNEEIRELVLVVPQAQRDWQAGQNVGVLVAGPHPMGHDVHFRLYTLAEVQAPGGEGKLHITLCVKRCSYIDEYSGEAFRGIASNFLCDRDVGDEVTLSGPYGLAFPVPEETSADLLLVGMGTGIAPFRAFIRHIYDRLGGWQGRVRLFYGGHSGMDMVYMNDERDDFAQYYDRQTFAAFKAVSPRPGWADMPALDEALKQRDAEIRDMLAGAETRVYVAGLQALRPMLNAALASILGSEEKWQRRKAELLAGGRWVELLF